MGKRLTYQQIKEYIESEETGNGCNLIMSEDKFEENIKQKSPSNTKIKIECACTNIFTATFEKFKHRNKKQCNICGNKEKISLRRLNYNDVLQKFLENNYILIDTHYSNVVTPLKFICIKHLDKGIQYGRYGDLQQGKHSCKYCLGEMRSEKYRKDVNDVKSEFINKNYTPLFSEKDYINNTSELKYICNIHKDIGEQFAKYSDLMTSDNNCQQCKHENNIGENNSNWQGGLTKIASLLRNHAIIDWKKDSMKNCNYNCVLTNGGFNAIHHLYSFTSILHETLAELNINIESIYINCNEIELDEHLQIEKTLQNNHYKHPLGVCICKKLHILFHKLYGKGSNIPTQFKEFIQRLESHEFDIYLLENNLTLNINHEILNKLLKDY